MNQSDWLTGDVFSGDNSVVFYPPMRPDLAQQAAGAANTNILNNADLLASNLNIF